MSRVILNILKPNITANTSPSSSNIWNGNTTEPGPLKNVRVVDVCEVISGPYTSGLLADLGADVIKIEKTNGVGDSFRLSQPRGPKVNDESSPHHNETIGMAFAIANRGKRSIALNLQEKKGVDILKQIVKDADVFVQNWRPGVAGRLGVNYDELKKINPKLIYLSISGYGQTGPYVKKKVYDSVIQAQIGMANSNGTGNGQNEPRAPQLIPNAVIDKTTSHTAVHAILAALYARDASGGNSNNNNNNNNNNNASNEGQHIELSMMDAGLSYIYPDSYSKYWTDENISHESNIAMVFDIWEMIDGAATVVALWGEPEFDRLITKFPYLQEIKDNPKFSDRRKRLSNKPEFTKEWNRIAVHENKINVKEFLNACEKLSIPAGKVSGPQDIFDDPQMKHMNSLVKSQNNLYGETIQPRPPYIFSKTKLSKKIKSTPMYGEHSIEILERLGYSPSEIEMLKRDKVFAKGIPKDSFLHALDVSALKKK